MKNFTYICFALALLITDAINSQAIQRVRVDFETPLGYTRQLLLGFTPDNAATDGFDYGYDALNGDQFPDDFSWMIEEEKYIIQGVGAFDPSKQYPVGMFMTNSGSISASLNSTENFETLIDVYLYDSHLNTYTLLNDTTFITDVAAGNVEDRFYITFSNNNLNSLSVADTDRFPFEMKYVRNNQELSFKSSLFTEINKIEIFNITGKKMQQLTTINNEMFSTKLPNNYTGIALIKVTTVKGDFLKKILLN